MRFMKAVVMGGAILTLVTTNAFSQSPTISDSHATSESTKTPVSSLRIGTVVRGTDIPSATLIEKSDNSFSFRIASTDGRPPIIVVVNGTPPSQAFSIEDGWKAINGALKAAGFGGPDVGPGTQTCTTTVIVVGNNNQTSTTVTCTTGR
jgi:hypothetical protein